MSMVEHTAIPNNSVFNRDIYESNVTTDQVLIQTQI